MPQPKWQKLQDIDSTSGKDRDLIRPTIAIGFIAVALVLGLGSIPPPLHTLSVPALVLRVTELLLSTALLAWLASIVFHLVALKRIPALLTPATKATLLVSLWIPAWILGLQRPTLVTILAACACMAILSLYLRRYTRNTSGEGSFTSLTFPFQFDSKPLGRSLLPFLGLAVLADLVLVVTALGRYSLASLLAGIWIALMVWKMTGQTTETRLLPLSKTNARDMGMVLLAFTFTLLTLLPSLKRVRVSFGPMPHMTASKIPARANYSSDGYSGIILLSPREEKKMITAPITHDPTHFGVKLVQPLEIPFDGAYWYFKSPDKAPRPTARVVRANSLKATIRSSDFYPLLMEAHQKLGTPIDLGCCSAIHLVVQNADLREGTVALELWVKKRPDPKAPAKKLLNAVPPEYAPHYLGTMTIPSSEHRGANATLPAEESLTFPVPAAMEGVTFDEITVVVRTAPARARTGAQIAIRRFVLEP